MDYINQLIDAYMRPYWTINEIMLVVGCKKTKAYDIKNEIIKRGGKVKGLSKVFRDSACRYLDISINDELKKIKNIKEEK